MYYQFMRVYIYIQMYHDGLVTGITYDTSLMRGKKVPTTGCTQGPSSKVLRICVTECFLHVFNFFSSSLYCAQHDSVMFCLSNNVFILNTLYSTDVISTLSYQMLEQKITFLNWSMTFENSDQDLQLSQSNPVQWIRTTFVLLLIHKSSSLYERRGNSPTYLGLYSLSGKTSYRQISQSLEAARSGVIMIVSLWNLTGISAAVLSRCLSNFRAMGNV